MLTVLKRFGNFIKHNGISLQKKKPCTPRTGSQCARLHIMGSLPRISLTQTELFNERTIRIGIAALEVIQQFAATADHATQATARMVVFHVISEERSVGKEGVCGCRSRWSGDDKKKKRHTRENRKM